MQAEIRHLSKKYRGREVLRDISLTASGGSCIGILGCNGCGKSTLLSILAGVQKPSGGEFFLDGVDLIKDVRRRSALVGYVPQGTPLIEELSAWDNLLLWYDRKALEQELHSGLLKLLEIESFLKTPVRHLSGGMKKRLSIGCAVAKHPPVLLLDEPTAALDLACKAQISRYLAQYRQAGGLLVLATHDIQELSLCDALYMMKNGVLVPYQFDGDVDRLVNQLCL